MTVGGGYDFVGWKDFVWVKWMPAQGGHDRAGGQTVGGGMTGPVDMTELVDMTVWGNGCPLRLALRGGYGGV